MIVLNDIFQGVLLGAIQGIGEFLPISSSGHLVIIPALFHWDYQGVGYDVVLHLGTLIAVVLFFRNDFKELGKAGLYYVADYQGGMKTYRVLLTRILFGSIPAVIAVLLFDNMLEVTARQPVVTAIALISMGLVLWIADVSGAKREKRKKEELSLAHMSIGQAFVIGCFQALALIPGVSRSGSTIAASLLLGYSRKNAARFSFLLSAPIVFGAFVFSMIDFIQNRNFSVGIIVGAVVAGVTGYYSIAFLLKFVERHSYRLFVLYRLVLGVAILIFWWLR